MPHARTPAHARTDTKPAHKHGHEHERGRWLLSRRNKALQIPHFGYSDELELDNLMLLRNQLKGVAADRGVKLSYVNPLFPRPLPFSLPNPCSPPSQASLPPLHSPPRVTLRLVRAPVVVLLVLVPARGLLLAPLSKARTIPTPNLDLRVTTHASRDRAVSEHMVP